MILEPLLSLVGVFLMVFTCIEFYDMTQNFAEMGTSVGIRNRLNIELKKPLKYRKQMSILMFSYLKNYSSSTKRG